MSKKSKNKSNNKNPSRKPRILMTPEEFNNKLSLTNTSSDPLKAMELISKSPDYSDDLIKYTDPKISENQFKLFIIAQCKREMYKLVEYSKWLDVLEDRFREVNVERVDELSPGQLMGIIKFLKDNIQASNEMINSVIKDKDITNVLVINSQTNNITDLTRSELLDKLYKASREKDETPASSRSKVVEVVTEILKEDVSEDEMTKIADTLLNGEIIEPEAIEEVQPIIVEEKPEVVEIQEEKSKLDISKLDFSSMSNEEIDKALKMLQEQGGN